MWEIIKRITEPLVKTLTEKGYFVEYKKKILLMIILLNIMEILSLSNIQENLPIIL